MAEHVLRIAHGYGNRPQRIAEAVAAGVDMIEADLRYHAGQVWVRHERRLRLLPLLYNYRLSPEHRRGPWALSLGPWFLRLDLRPIRLEGLIETVAGKAGLLLDLKTDGYSRAEARAFLETVREALQGFAGPVAFCGSWPLLDLLRDLAPNVRAHYSVDNPAQWDALQPRLGVDDVRAITFRYGLLDEDRAAQLRERGIAFYCWAVRDPAGAERAVALGASGIIADDLEVLKMLAGSRRTR
ncbi:MAG: glycerophosphodiester phosphodiesterase [Chloroflexi bacterium]|nr:glycerophosphodiester phosphodiesterase [Chloroflexota bacterium]